MTRCSAAACQNESDKYQMFHIRKEMQSQWIQNLRREDWKTNPPKNFSNCQVCEVCN